MPTENGDLQAAFARLAADHVDAGLIADTAVRTWRDIVAALSPIVGQRGVAALYKRSLHLTRTDYPWLAATATSPIAPGDFTPLRAALAEQTASSAAAASGALLQIFLDLLGSLIGEALAERLLQSVWDNLSSGQDSQDSPGSQDTAQ